METRLDYQKAQALLQFSEEELAKLTFAITQINSWNRIAIAFRAEVGSYQPQAAAAHKQFHCPGGFVAFAAAPQRGV
jgi:hypothetical protein